MRIFIYKCIIVFFGIYLTYNFTIGKKIDEYESKLIFLLTDQGREQIRQLIRKEIKNSIDNETLLKKNDQILLRKFIDKLKSQKLKFFKEKLIKIFIHGFLHLIGFNHEKNKDYKKMLKEEDLIYQSVISKIN